LGGSGGIGAKTGKRAQRFMAGAQQAVGAGSHLVVFLFNLNKSD
jgi:hypothetical protein